MREYDFNIWIPEDVEDYQGSYGYRIALEIYESDEFGSRKYETNVVYHPTYSEQQFIRETFSLEEFGTDFWVGKGDLLDSLKGYNQFSVRILKAWLDSLPDAGEYFKNTEVQHERDINIHPHYVVRVGYCSGEVRQVKYKWYDEAKATFDIAKFWNGTTQLVRIDEDGVEHVEEN